MKKALPTTISFLLFFSLTLACCLTGTIGQAQTKVFKEVSEDISSQMNTIEQDGALVGYMAFTQLEKASADSFNYRVTIMDENLNDIGTVNFKEQKLFLRAVSFEGDVLCLAYLKSNIVGNEFKNKREYKDAILGAKASVFTQFLSMDGKIIRTNSVKADLKVSGEPLAYYNKMGFLSKVVGDGSLKHDIQLRNISGKGFACFYGDDNKNNLLVFNTAGKLTWQKTVRDEAVNFGLLTSGQDAYLLLKTKDDMKEGGFELVGFNTADSSLIPKYVLKDKKGNSLKVLSFDNDPVTGKPYVSGNIINQEKGMHYAQGKRVTRGLYSGLFTINFNGHKKGEIQEVYSYWDDGSISDISKKGYFESLGGFAWVDHSFRDYQGNTYFAGSSLIRRTRWVTIGVSALLAITIIVPIELLGAGTQKYKLEDAILLKQNAKGALSLENSIPGKHSQATYGGAVVSDYEPREIHCVTNSDTKTNYLIIDETKNITIYNVTQKKVARMIPHKDGNTLTSIYPAKEGHVMVSEYNKKEKYTRFSIETL
jgi:hypothetical protein